MVFQKFYEDWYTTQHHSYHMPDPHSLFRCYANRPVCPNTYLPLYLTALMPPDASIISRLRFNRSRLNQSLYKRHRANTDKCSTCPNTVETVEHVVMSCPRYDKYRFKCFWLLSKITNQVPLSSSFPFPFLLGSFPDGFSTTQQQKLIATISPSCELCFTCETCSHSQCTLFH
jgi:hypothetical protein